MKPHWARKVVEFSDFRHSLETSIMYHNITCTEFHKHPLILRYVSIKNKISFLFIVPGTNPHNIEILLRFYVVSANELLFY